VRRPRPAPGYTPGPTYTPPGPPSGSGAAPGHTGAAAFTAAASPLHDHAAGPAASGTPGPAPNDQGAAGSGAQASPIPPAPLATLPRAGFWIRMGALVIDVIVVSVVLDLLFGGWGWHYGWYHGTDRSELVVLAAYGAIMWKTLQGRTVGGMVCDLQVVRLDGHELDWPTVIVRALGCVLSAAVVGLGFFWIVIDDGRQAWHDKLAGTVVVRVPRKTHGPQQP
jgi:uncharacterized RDD family membrane protein YckC